jgi:hypothetical protein
MSKAKPTKKHKLAKRIVRWLTYNVIFALMPLAVSILIRALTNKLSVNDLSSSPEILFFALTISATAMGDLSEVAIPIGWDITLTIFGSALTLGAVLSAIIYGCLLYDSIISTGSIVFHERLLWISVSLSIILFVLSTAVEIIIGKIEGKS